jgi:hypothetical protein
MKPLLVRSRPEFQSLLEEAAEDKASPEARSRESAPQSRCGARPSTDAGQTQPPSSGARRRAHPTARREHQARPGRPPLPRPRNPPPRTSPAPAYGRAAAKACRRGALQAARSAVCAHSPYARHQGHACRYGWLGSRSPRCPSQRCAAAVAAGGFRRSRNRASSCRKPARAERTASAIRAAGRLARPRPAARPRIGVDPRRSAPRHRGRRLPASRPTAR